MAIGDRLVLTANKQIPVELEAPRALSRVARTVRNLYAKRDELFRDQQTLRDSISIAVRGDRAADELAAREGKELPVPRAPEYQADLEACERNIAATEAALRTALFEQCATLATVHQAWMGTLHSQRVEAARATLGAIHTLTERMLMLQQISDAEAGLGYFDPGHPNTMEFDNGRQLSYYIRRNEKLARQAHDSARLASTTILPVNDPEVLLAALTVAVEILVEIPPEPEQLVSDPADKLARGDLETMSNGQLAEEGF